VALVATVPLAVLTAPAGADQIGDLKAKASELASQISAAQAQSEADGQRYDQAMLQLQTIQDQITVTKAKIAADQHQVDLDKNNLRSVAINSYVNLGAQQTSNPLFESNQETFAARQEYSQVATGNLDVAVAQLHTAQVQLNAQYATLATQQNAAQSQVSAAASARAAADAQASQLQAAQNQVQGELVPLEAQAAAQAAAAQNAATTARLTSSPSAAANYTPPPHASGGAAAVAAAESQIGVPYVWGGETPGVGFDCSGLTAWAWGQAGVGLPHYSGAQMADSAPVPVSDLEPGDLLFYGPGGSDHVAMYIGGGQMIEAPYTGATVWITALRLGDGFVGAGRP
jgi:peptidoglycan DL-endopeptidase CwlO